MHVFKISVGQKVVGQTSWLAHWEQKVGGPLPALPNRLRRQCLHCQDKKLHHFIIAVTLSNILE